jgi:predicted AAA+ superfamily ATPase
MVPFHIANARNMTVKEMLRFDTGRLKQRELVTQAILDSSHNVYLYGSRGSGKTFFQKTQAYYFSQLDDSIIPIYLSSEFQWRSNPEEFALHILNTVMLYT